jgi:hypothetical protein
MTPKEKAQELYIEYNSMNLSFNHYDFRQQALRSHTKQCALLAVEKEYNSLREQLCNLRSCHVIENEKVYLARIDLLNQEESQIKAEIEAL